MPPPYVSAELPYIEPCQKRVRVLFAGKYIIDTVDAKLVWLKPNYPYYFFDFDSVNQFLKGGHNKGEYTEYTVKFLNKSADHAARRYKGRLGDLVYIEFGAMDAWFEEDEEIFVHPKDPYKRVDVLHSSRHVQVKVNGIVVANTTRPRLLFETSLPVRTYIPKTDCMLDLLVPSDLTTQCPYKGVASYYDVHLPDGTKKSNIVWWYRTPQLECAEIKGCVAFYDEMVEVWVDNKLQKQPTN